MSGRTGPAPIVSREYRIAPDACKKAIEILLKRSAKKQGGPAIAAPDDAMKGSKHDRAKSRIP